MAKKKGSVTMISNVNLYAAVKNSSYNKGLNDAWTLVNKIDNMSMDKRNNVFGVSFTEDVLSAYTGQEALAKLEAYEKEQAEIKVGDVVIDLDGHERVVLFIDLAGIAQIYSRYGVTHIDKIHLKKTGKHIDLQTILEQIAGD